MKKRLIALFNLGRSVDQSKDRGGKYSLEKVNQLAKLGPTLKTSAPRPVAPVVPAKPVKVDPQPSLFESVEAPVEPVAAQPVEQAAAPVTLESDANVSTPEVVMKKPIDAPAPVNPVPKARPVSWAKLKTMPIGILKFSTKPAVLVWQKIKGPGPDVRPRAQAELDLEKITVLRNDLSDADVMVVANPRKPLSAAEPPPSAGTNSWTKATARWIKLKDTAEGEARTETPASRPQELAQSPP